MSLGGSMIERSPNKSLNRSIQTYTIEPNYKEIALNLLSCSFQTALGYICLDVVFAISLHFVQADISAVANAGVGLAYTICSIMVLPMGFGVNQSLNVHVAQALGAEQTKLSKTYLPMTFWVHFMYFVPFSLILYFLKVPFSYTIPAADRAETVDAAWEYLPWMLLSSIFAIELECFKSYLIAHEIFTPFIVIHFSTTGLHVLWCWLLIQKAGMGIEGAGIAIVLTEVHILTTQVLNILFLGLFVLFMPDVQKPFLGVQVAFPLIKQAKLLLSYVKSSLAIVIHVYADFLAFFMLTIISMQLGTTLFNAQIAFSNTSAFYFRLPISLSIGLMTYVGSEMGKRRYKVAQKYSIAGVIIFVCSAAVLMALLYLLRDPWASFYSNDDATKKALLDTLPSFLVGCLFVDGFQGSISGGLKGIDKKNLVTYTTLIVYYIFGTRMQQSSLAIPLVLVFTFGWGFDLGVTGIWLAFGVANLMLLVMYLFSLLTTDWHVQQEIICKRVEEQDRLQKKKYSIIHEEYNI